MANTTHSLHPDDHWVDATSLDHDGYVVQYNTLTEEFRHIVRSIGPDGWVYYGDWVKGKPNANTNVNDNES